MRIVILSTDFKPLPGGIAEMSHQVARGLARRGHEVTVATGKWTAPDWDDKEQSYSVARLLDVRWFPSRRSIRGILEEVVWSRNSRERLRAIVADVAPDAILATNYHTLWMPVIGHRDEPFFQFLVGEDVAGCLATRWPHAKPRMTATLQRATRIFAISRYPAELVSTLLHGLSAKVTVVGCGFPTDGIVPLDDHSQPRQSDGPVLLTASRLVMRKGIDTVLHALKHLEEPLPSLRYVVIGDGPDRQALESLARDLGLSDRVEFAGHVTEEAKRRQYLSSDLYVMPSRPGRSGECEGFGISFLEANAHGLAVIGSTVGGVPDAVEDGVNGVLVPPGDADALAAAIKALLLDPERRRRMALAGQKRIRGRFNWDSIAERIESAIHDAVARPSPPVCDGDPDRIVGTRLKP